MSKWLEFREEKTKGKTQKFIVWSKCDDIDLGEIKWYSHWRHYCFFVYGSALEDIVFSDRCLLEISKFITKLNKEYKKGKK